MGTINIAIEDNILEWIDRAALELGISRSQFIERALIAALNKFSINFMEQKQAEGYQKYPVIPEEFEAWDDEQSWVRNEARRNLMV